MKRDGGDKMHKRTNMARFLKGSNEGIRKEYLRQENSDIKAIQAVALKNRKYDTIRLNGIVKGVK